MSEPGLSGAELVSVAERIARSAHKGQTDKAGRPYVGHLERVTARLELEDRTTVAAGWLHDVLEDTAVSAGELLDAGFSESLVETLLVLSRVGKTNEEYYAAVKADPVALAVKLADLADNSAPERLALLPEETRTRLRAKYAKAYRALGRNDLTYALVMV